MAFRACFRMRSVCGSTSAIGRIKWRGLLVFKIYCFLSISSAAFVGRRGRVCAGLVGLVAGVGLWGRPLYRRPIFPRYVTGGGSVGAPWWHSLARQVPRFASIDLHYPRRLARWAGHMSHLPMSRTPRRLLTAQVSQFWLVGSPLVAWGRAL